MNIHGIAIKTAKRAPLKEVGHAEITVGFGLEGDVRGAGGTSRQRQVTLLSLQQWKDACKALDIELPWPMRRAGLCVAGIAFGPSDVGRKVRIGGNVELLITGETEPCSRMDEIFPGLMAALAIDWRGGVTTKVIKGGTVRINSPVVFL